ncbi:MAG: hydrogenase expression protein [Deltaproteobacteria bacterium]|nr:hydrogenase expression protein [Deltaproteobacteria bacterium]
MTSSLRHGKLPPELLREILAEQGDLPSEVRLGPALGEDGCAIDVPAGTLIAATDPITLTGSDVGAHAVTINANDIAVMGVRPRWFLAVVLLPTGSCESDVRALFASMRSALEGIGATLVGGHTEVSDAVNQPIVIGQMMGFSPEHRFVQTGGARAGDRIVQAGLAPVEAAAVLAAEVNPRLDAIDPRILDLARRAVAQPGISVVDAALLATEEGATALHDPTEGGLSAGLHELAEASGVKIQLDEAAVLWFEPGRAVCGALGADPWGALASGALLAAFPPDRAANACRLLEERGIPARVIGEAVSGSGVLRSDHSPLPTFARDEVARILGARSASE